MILPVELWIEVFGQLEVKELLTASAVCHQWRHIILCSDNQMFGRMDVPIEPCDTKYRLAEQFGPRFNSQLRKSSIANTINKGKCIVLDKFEQVASSSEMYNGPKYYMVQQSAGDYDYWHNYETDTKSERKTINYETTGQVYHFKEFDLVCKHQSDDKCHITVFDDEGNYYCDALLDDIQPVDFILNRSILAAVEDHSTSYYSLPDWRFLSRDQESHCNIVPFGQNYLVLPPADLTQPLRIRSQNDSEWRQVMAVKMPRFSALRLSNCQCSSRHVAFTMTRRDLYSYRFLFLMDAITQTARCFLHLDSSHSSGTWHIGWEGEAIYSA